MKPRLVVHVDPASKSTMNFGKRLCAEAESGESNSVDAYGPSSIKRSRARRNALTAPHANVGLRFAAPVTSM